VNATQRLPYSDMQENCQEKPIPNADNSGQMGKIGEKGGRLTRESRSSIYGKMITFLEQLVSLKVETDSSYIASQT
jgi:hypothetical protein